MYNVFLILGYGIPKNIIKDEHYNHYLKTAFNRIYDCTMKDITVKPLIICCGGETDMLKPYKRNEADEMVRFFKELIKQKAFLIPVIKSWKFVSENKSLSTLENLVNSNKIILKHNLVKTNIYIICEQTRENRIKILGKKIFDKNYKINTLPIDFDMSTNRYLSPDFIEKKEKAELDHSLWALKNHDNLKRHHALYLEKIEFLRTAGSKAHVNADKEWWEKKLKELNK